ncbi:MAG: hypothetical protein JW847_01780 [Candidatus Omnitrophica bacterium]|nr:hypothetical protein [Candidatus Omnitrophota bacterium]
MRTLILLLTFVLLSVNNAFAAVGCDLSDPDRDVKRLFPESTGYKTEYVTIEERGGQELAGQIEAKLGEALDSFYETLDVPYAFYRVLKGKEVVGYVHGVNQKGQYGGMQLILATDLHGKILEFYYQKISSPEAKQFRDKNFTRNFTGLTLEDFLALTIPKGSQGVEIQDPSENSQKDFLATLRGVKKNLILLDEFVLGNNSSSVLQEGGNNNADN